MHPPRHTDFAPGERLPVTPLPPFDLDPSSSGAVLAPPHLHSLADQIVHLNMMEVKQLMDRIGGHFGFADDDGGYDDDNTGAAAGEGEEAEVVEEKTIFDLKLVAFDAKAKIKVIKEIRGVTSLGLKEAKELVEGAPVSSIFKTCSWMMY